MTSKDTIFYTKKILNCKGKLIDITQPIIMGILNLTPDSFYDGGKYNNEEALLKRVKKIIDDGASILDIGGYSSRPGAAEVSIEKELSRVLPAIKSIKKAFPKSTLSIDTFRASVAKEAINHGADIINDISGGDLDQDMFTTVAELNVPYIIMHMRGTPKSMAEKINYKNVTLEVVEKLQEKIKTLHSLGVSDVIADPGFGFAKTSKQNYELLNHLNYFKSLGVPILVGISRKSMIYKTLNISPDDALNGTTVLNTVAITKGASILRVHDVKEANEIVQLLKMLQI